MDIPAEQSMPIEVGGDQPRMEMSALPDEILRTVLRLLPPPENRQASLVCRRWNLLVSQDLSLDNTEPGAEISDLPNEILRMIFRLLAFRERRNASLVCHRWNQIIFQTLNDQICFRLHQNQDLPGCLSEDRVYKHVRIQCLTLGILNLQHGSRLHTLGPHAKSLAIEVDACRGEMLVALLIKFPVLQSLKLRIGTFIFEGTVRAVKYHLTSIESLDLRVTAMLASPQRFKQILMYNLPSVHQLALNCQYMKLLDLLFGFGTSLVILDLTIEARLLYKLRPVDFLRLQVLSLKISRPSPALSRKMHTFIPQLQSFLASLKNLKKFSIESPDAYFAEVIQAVYSLTTLEELKINTTSKVHRSPSQCGLDNIWRLTSLRVLDTNLYGGLFCPPKQKIYPMRHVEQITTASSFSIALMTEMFPNAKVVCTNHQIITVTNLKSMVSAWPGLESLETKLQTLEEESLDLLHQFPKLRRLYLGNCMSKQEHANALVSIPSLKELNLGATDGVDVTQAQLLNPTCRVNVFYQR